QAPFNPDPTKNVKMRIAAELAFLTDLAAYCRPGEGDSCDAWFTRMHRLGAHLGPDVRTRRQRPQIVPMRFPHLEAGNLTPWTIASVGGNAVWALLDTGAPHAVLGRDRAHLWGLDYTVVGDPFTQRLWDGAEPRHRLVVLRDFELGAAIEVRALAVAVDDHRVWNSLALGMDVLLRYGSVCFAWLDGTLHLGRPGPCAHGVSPYVARLDPESNKPVVLVPGSDDATVSVLVDTGSRDNHCKQSLAERLQGRPLVFGEHPTLQAGCNPNSKWPAKHEDNRHAMTIGMETLSKFEAFGWHLDPFHMYFVPRTGPVVMGSNASTKPERLREFLEERLVAAARAAGNGDFPAAWTNLRLASWTALSSREAADARNAFCARRPCPDIWRIAWLAGRAAPGARLSQGPPGGLGASPGSPAGPLQTSPSSAASARTSSQSPAAGGLSASIVAAATWATPAGPRRTPPARCRFSSTDLPATSACVPSSKPPARRRLHCSTPVRLTRDSDGSGRTWRPWNTSSWATRTPRREQTAPSGAPERSCCGT
ncbi:MAG: retropepsin-like aspartic protease, partial [Gammaproteobacteria bacterium]|nr:retropepsin-like aspartic protease [Gammaproteobacteria bacterium]